MTKNEDVIDIQMVPALHPKPPSSTPSGAPSLSCRRALRRQELNHLFAPAGGRDQDVLPVPCSLSPRGGSRIVGCARPSPGPSAPVRTWLRLGWATPLGWAPSPRYCARLPHLLPALATDQPPCSSSRRLTTATPPGTDPPTPPPYPRGGDIPPP